MKSNKKELCFGYGLNDKTFAFIIILIVIHLAVASVSVM